LEHVLQAAAEAGAKVAGYTTLRLPHELKQLFREWLAAHVPQRAEHVMSLVQQMNGGRDYDADFRTRMHGQGAFAQLIARRFEVACTKFGYARRGGLELDCTRFAPPHRPSPQGKLGYHRLASICGRHRMSFALYLLGSIVVICGLAYGAWLAHLPTQWIVVGVVVLLGIGILTGVSRTRRKDPPSN